MDSPERPDLSLHSFSDLDKRIWHFNVGFIGSSRAGKTKLLQRFVDSQYSDIYNCTGEIAFVSKSISLGQHHVIFQCWDTPGSARTASCLDSRLVQLHAVFIVFDGSRDAIADLEHWHHLALKSPGVAKPPLLVMVANKTDLGCHQATMTRARDLCNAANGLVFTLSVLADEENLEVDAMMLEVGKVLTERCVHTAPPSPAPSPLPLDNCVQKEHPTQQSTAMTDTTSSPQSKFNDKVMGDGVDKAAAGDGNVKNDGAAPSSGGKEPIESGEKSDWLSRLCCCNCW